MPLTVLVVDDTDAVRERLVELVASVTGVGQVWQADGFYAARRVLATCRPDLVVLDIRLRDGSGVGLLPSLREAGRSPVVTMLTSFPLEPYRRRCMAAGADYFLDKSSEVDRLLEITAALVHQQENRS